jgi:hypothetical protein
MYLEKLEAEASHIKSLQDNSKTFTLVEVPQAGSFRLANGTLVEIKEHTRKQYNVIDNDGNRITNTTVSGTFSPVDIVPIIESLYRSILQLEKAEIDIQKIELDYRGDNGQIIDLRFPLIEREIPTHGQRHQGDVYKVDGHIRAGVDGSLSRQFNLSYLFCWCDNQCMTTKDTILYRGRNTIGNDGKLELYCNDLYKLLDREEFTFETFKSMSLRPVTRQEVDRFLDVVLDIKDRKEISTYRTNQLRLLESKVELEMARRGNTLHGLYQGVTNFTTHEVKGDFMLGHKLKMNERALNLARELVMA